MGDPVKKVEVVQDEGGQEEVKTIMDFLSEEGCSARFSFDDVKHEKQGIPCFARLTDSEYRISVSFLETDAKPAMFEGVNFAMLSMMKHGTVYSARLAIENNETTSNMLCEIVRGSLHSQRRSFYRIDTQMTIFFESGDPLSESMTTLARTKCNISGGGVAFRLPRQVEEDQVLNLKLAVRGRLIKCSARVIRRTPAPKKGHYDIATQFVAISDIDREEIVSFCNEEQRRELSALARVRDHFS